MSLVDNAIVPITESDVGNYVNVSDNGIAWDCLVLARILTKPAYDDEEREERIGYACWLDDSTAMIATYKMAKHLTADPSRSPEVMYVQTKQAIAEIEEKLKREKAYLNEIEKVITEDWQLNLCARKEIRMHDGRRASLTLSNAVSCSILAANREAVRSKVEEYGIEGVVVTGVDTSRLKKWMTEGAATNPDGTLDFSFMPHDMIELISVYQRTKLSMRSLGARDNS